MPEKKAEKRFFELWGELCDLHAARSLAEWDQETHMPGAAHRQRGEVQATLAGFVHRSMTAPELSDVLAQCSAAAEPGSVLAAQVRSARREVDRAVKIPERLVREIAAARAAALRAWQEAREKRDFELFAGPLEQMVALRREEADVLGSGQNPYDVLLDHYEPGATAADLRSLMKSLVAELTPLVREVAESGIEVDESSARGHFPGASQVAFGRRLAAALGFDFEAGRLDPSSHPFCIRVHQNDVRMTYRYREEDFRPFLFGILHETGHCLYEQGLPEPWRRTPLDESASVGVHESQSRLWENHVGRSRGFWQWALPLFHEAFPQAPGLTVDEVWPTLHTVRRSLVRVDADELTYHLHIAVRFELELALFDGSLEVSGLAAAWDELYERYLGVRPRDPVEGVLQDIHWSHGSFGYFPTYTLGSMMAAQLYTAAERDLGPLEKTFAAGEFGVLLDWLRERVHQTGQRYLPAELVERATGRPLDAADLLAYLKKKTEAIYGQPA